MIKEKTTSFSNLSKYGYLNLPVPNRKNIVDKNYRAKEKKKRNYISSSLSEQRTARFRRFSW